MKMISPDGNSALASFTIASLMTKSGGGGKDRKNAARIVVHDGAACCELIVAPKV